MMRGVYGKTLRLALSITAPLAAYPVRAAPLSPVLKVIEYGGDGLLRDTFQDMELTVDAIGPPDVRGPRLRVAIAGRPAFKLQLAGESGNSSAVVKIVRLGGASPQVLFQHFTYGAHCCVVTKIATQIDSHWKAVVGDAQDGDRGYDIEDIAGDGIGELIGADDSFLYAFSGYASSLPPIRIQALQGAALIDVTKDPRLRSAVVASLSSIEPKKSDDDRWRSNGFLAGWVATKVLLGDGPAAWRKMLANYGKSDSEPDWPMEVCADATAAHCLASAMRPATFPEALRRHLLDHGYIVSVADYPLPGGTPPR